MLGEVDYSNSNDQSSHEEKMFYSKLNCYRSRLKFAKKMMLYLDSYEKISFTDKQAKGGETNVIDNTKLSKNCFY